MSRRHVQISKYEAMTPSREWWEVEGPVTEREMPPLPDPHNRAKVASALNVLRNMRMLFPRQREEINRQIQKIREERRRIMSKTRGSR